MICKIGLSIIRWIEYICYINFLKVTAPVTGMIFVTDDSDEDHLDGKNSDDVSLMWFKSVNFKFLPVLGDNVMEKYPNLRKIVFDGRQRIETDLNLIAREDYSEYAKITKLEIVHFRENLKQLPTQLLAHAAELLDFHAIDNRVVEIPESIFWHSPKLNAVDLNGNEIKTISAKIFVKNPKITHIFLANNEIVTLPAELIKFNPLLQEFKVDENTIEFMPASFYKNNPLIEKKFNGDNEDEGVRDVSKIRILSIQFSKPKRANHTKVPSLEVK